MSLFFLLPSGVAPAIVIVDSTFLLQSFISGPAAAIIWIKPDGHVYSDLDGYGIESLNDLGTWLDTGNANQVWIEYSVVSGTPSSDSYGGAGVRVSCTTAHQIRLNQATPGTNNCVVDIDFYDAPSGGTLLDSTRVTMEADDS